MGVTQEIVSFIHGARFQDLPPDVVDRARDLITDSVGTMLAGSVEKGSKILQTYVKGISDRGESTVAATDFKTAAGPAALANAAAGHALDFDSIQVSSWPGTTHGIRIHPTTPALAASLALGEPLGVSGRSLILACVVGIEVASRVTEAIPPESYQVAYQSTATMGGLGAAAAAGKLLELDQEMLMRAMGLAATMAGGLRENFGTMTKAFHSGRAAEAGVIAASLARDGFTSAPHILEARRGFFLSVGGKHEASRIVGKLGRPYFLIDPGIHIKRYPCAILTHPSIEALLELVRTHDLKAEQIERLEVGVSEVVTSTLAHPEPKTGLEGKFSVAFPLSLAILERRVGLDQFTDGKARDERTVALLKKIKVYNDHELEKAKGSEVAARLELRLMDGQVWERVATLEKGPTQAWIGEDELAEKFRACASQAFPGGRVEKLLGMLRRLEQLGNIGPLMELLVKQG